MRAINIFQRLFGWKPTIPAETERAELLSGGVAVFTPWSGDAYANDIYRGAVDAIARNAAKLKGSHVVRYQQHLTPQEGRLNRILQVQPNPCMSGFDMLYKLVTHYYEYNNAFTYLHKDDRVELVGAFPLRPLHMDFLADAAGTLYCKFLFHGSRYVTLPYMDIVHLRRHFNDNDLLGDDNAALSTALELAHTQNEGIINGIKVGAQIRGILHYTQTHGAGKAQGGKRPLHGRLPVHGE